MTITHVICAVEGCGRPTPVRYPVCTACLNELRRDLADLAHGPMTKTGQIEPGLLDDLTDVMARLTRSGMSTGIRARSAESPLPYDVAASDLLWTARNTISVWALDVHNANPRHVPPRGTLAEVAEWLAGEQAIVARHPGIVQLRDEVSWVAAQVRTTVDIAPTRVYLGECGSQADWVCREPLYALHGHTTTRCRGCGAVYDVSLRRAEKLDEAQDVIAPAGDIARALSLMGQPLSVRRVRVWAHRGRITQHEPHRFDPRQRPRYRLGDVVTLLLQPQPKVARRLDAEAGAQADIPLHRGGVRLEPVRQ